MREIVKRWEDDNLTFERISNNNLICKDCIFRFDDSEVYGNTSRCLAFIDKPNGVLMGGDCDEYEAE